MLNDISTEELVTIPVGDRDRPGILAVPPAAAGVVLFVHGSGSGRHSPRNRRVARGLYERGLASLLVDLLDEDEAGSDRDFDVPLLASRTIEFIDWLSADPRTARLSLGLFGASTGAAAALAAAAQRPTRVAAVVARGGRPDLAAEVLPRVHAPTLLVVGEADVPVVGLNRQALARLPIASQMAVVPGATHLFPEPGALEEVIRLAGDWFLRHRILPARPTVRKEGSDVPRS